jgi:DNA-binding MarR family transcriptional regulator
MSAKTKALSETDPEQSTGYILWHVAHQMHQLMIEELKDLNVVPAQIGALAHIARNEAISNAELARRLLLTPQNMSLTTAKLEGAGYLRKMAHETHGRIKKLEITVSGKKLLIEAIKRMKNVEDRMTAHMGPEESRRFNQTLKISLQALTGQLRRKDVNGKRHYKAD